MIDEAETPTALISQTCLQSTSKNQSAFTIYGKMARRQKYQNI